MNSHSSYSPERGREEVVIQALNEGADFYLQKGGDLKAQFAELRHKIRQAVQQRQKEAIIRDHERREADIINFLPDATFAIDKSGHVIAWNRAIEEMTGIAASDILGKGDFEYAIPFYGSRRRILIDLILESDEIIRAQYAHIIHQKRGPDRRDYPTSTTRKNSHLDGKGKSAL